MAKDIRMQVMVDQDFIKRVDDYRFENRIGSRGATIRLLIDKALEFAKDLERDKKKKARKK
jgi:metal-responsive CopG/Arc/MetJ family transcriptional regulator